MKHSLPLPVVAPGRRPMTRALMVGVALLIAGCASFKGIAPTGQTVAEVRIPVPAAVPNASGQWPAQDWWKAYDDPQLNRLMDHALESSPTLATARSRLARAQSAIDLTRSGSGPQVSGNANASYGRLTANGIIPPPPLGPGGTYVTQDAATVNFGYDIDLWGKNEALIRSADAQLQAATHDRDAARLALTTSIARAYAQLASDYELRDLLESTRTQRGSISKLTQLRAKNGLDTQVESKQAEGTEAALGVDLAQLATSMEVTRLQIAQLTGDMPDAAAKITRPALHPQPFTIPHDLPLGLLARRPDVAARRARIEATVGEAAAARAQFYPDINLTALIGFQSIGLGQLLSAGSLVNGIGPAITLPIFDAGRLRANYAGKTADIDTAIAQYNQSVVDAAQDVAEQLTRVAALGREQAAVSQALSASEEAYRLATLRYKAGLSTNLTVLTVQTQVLAQRRAAADLNMRRTSLQIGLIRALGGGFIVPDSASSATPTAKRAQSPLASADGTNDVSRPLQKTTELNK
ncbi:MAG: efflux transporter outer rane subunit [Herminiimonas sp.]|nr:efflux transporter outer rane subunit [Herminiimonas sp.]